MTSAGPWKILPKRATFQGLLQLFQINYYSVAVLVAKDPIASPVKAWVKHHGLFAGGKIQRVHFVQG